MSDNYAPTGSVLADSHLDTLDGGDLDVRTETFEITPALVAENLSFGGPGVKLPSEMMGTLERIWLDRDFVWPTTIAITRVTLSVEPDDSAEPPQQVWSRVSVIGTGFSSDTPVTLRWLNAFGFADNTIVLPEVQADDGGFFGVDVFLKTTPRSQSDFVWGAEQQLVLSAEQAAAGADGSAPRTAEQRRLPPHIVWQWTR